MVDAPAGAMPGDCFPIPDPHSQLTMTLSARRVLSALILLIGGALVVLATTRPQPAEVRLEAYQPPEHASGMVANGKPLGLSGCLATACHGGPPKTVLTKEKLTKDEQDNIWKSSGSCWIAADRHTMAFSVLTGELATKIMKEFADSKPATEDARCLACHTNPSLAHATDDPHRLRLRTEGVSCEACHGNSSGWISAHTIWTGARGEFYDKTGMTKLYDIGERAMTCVGCHVGAPAEGNYPVRDMNHDMIAAGHPRLNFDFAEYQRRLPKHWQEKDRAGEKFVFRSPEFPAKEWLIGRVAHAEAACRLLADRAERAEKGEQQTPWPEFAEFNCAACHHDIPDEQRRTDSYLGERKLGTLAWQTLWPGSYRLKDSNEPTPQDRLRELMQSRRPPGPKQVQPLALDATKQAADWRYSVSRFPDSTVLGMVLAFQRVDLPKHSVDGDEIGQMLYGLTALQRTRREPPHPAFAEAFANVKKKKWSAANANIKTLRDALIGPRPK